MAETSGGLLVRLFTLFFCVVKLERRVVNSDRVFCFGNKPNRQRTVRLVKQRAVTVPYFSG